GGREHALVWKLAQSDQVRKLYCAPGNAGIAQVAECVDIAPTDIRRLVQFARRRRIDLTVVGPEAPLVAGIVDEFQHHGLRIFGPTAAAAELEGSKAFAKEFARRHGIPTAAFATFMDPEAAWRYIDRHPLPVVLKADGLAAGKGVVVCESREQARVALEAIMVQRAFGQAGETVVVEEFLEGEEASLLVVTDGDSYRCLAPAQDHKRLFDGDQGPNTGGMGAYAPAPVVDAQQRRLIEEQLVRPTIQGMLQEGRPYCGVLYFGLMITPQGPRLLEYNCRFGDPETQAVLPLLADDLLVLMNAAIDGELAKVSIKENTAAAVCVVIASAGYPGSYEKGKPIAGLDRQFPENVLIFHAGTRMADGQVLTDGGRVLGVTAVEESIPKAIRTAYGVVKQITFDGAYYRKDIGARALQRLQRT
ncbi:MAG: phosphoribosylamine--glycine ligase, partial [candidate division KSB1 bacterium]|nr:phosphoribosylamine--glycine ligase [candidate division KSB1 bacterium]